MPWLSLKLSVPAWHAEPLSDWLSDQGAVAVTARDARREEGEEGARGAILEPDPLSTPLWDEVELDALFDAEHDLAGMRDALAEWFAQQGEALPELAIELVGDEDWSATWRGELAPQRFGEQLWVIPREMPASPYAGTVLRLDPGMAFGTGGHATTALCLEWLDEADVSGQQVIDYGCGSGILAIAALLLGAERVLALDHDPQALMATAENAEVNGIEPERLAVLRPGRALEAFYGKQDLVLANILADPLKELAPELTRLLRLGGRIVLSGILKDQLTAVTDAYPAIRFDAPRILEGWACIAGTKVATEPVLAEARGGE